MSDLNLSEFWVAADRSTDILAANSLVHFPVKWLIMTHVLGPSESYSSGQGTVKPRYKVLEGISNAENMEIWSVALCALLMISAGN